MDPGQAHQLIPRHLHSADLQSRRDGPLQCQPLRQHRLQAPHLPH